MIMLSLTPIHYTENQAQKLTNELPKKQERNFYKYSLEISFFDLRVYDILNRNQVLTKLNAASSMTS